VVRVALLTACLLVLPAAPARASRTVYPDSAGNLHVFVVGADGVLYHDASTGRGAWRGFASLGGNLAPSERVAVGRNVSALVSKPLKVGTQITITATAPGTIGAVKTLTIRSRRAPAVKTRCLPPGSTRPAAC
jgi:hypothetical protein